MKSYSILFHSLCGAVLLVVIVMTVSILEEFHRTIFDLSNANRTLKQTSPSVYRFLRNIRSGMIKGHIDRGEWLRVFNRRDFQKLEETVRGTGNVEACRALLMERASPILRQSSPQGLMPFVTAFLFRGVPSVRSQVEGLCAAVCVEESTYPRQKI